MNKELLTAYRHHREKRRRATEALSLARKDVAAKTPRYAGGQQYKRNNQFTIGGHTLEWMEQPANFGLRFVGYADEVCKRNYAYNGEIDHTGWYSDDMQYQTLRGAVFQLPARNGQSVYVAGYVEQENRKPINGDSAAIDLSRLFYGEPSEDGASYITAAREAARAADAIAERVAEKEREYAEVWRKGSDYAELGEEVAAARKSCLALIAEIKAQGKAFSPAICDTLKAHVSSYVRDIQKAREKRESLKSDCYHWQYAAFNEGAGETVFPS